ncbi:hypothetical protein CALVIDRAFT_602786 [Calocera viscosa TUFC12733]|uniref:GTP binding protein 2 n=1 Tax=Calocera viscosa (strain TUFC12733) TaxID=1330018 RepID=A0A167GJE8_CALVF|nr:hypothetical protein CALVIDRAFT_602786 [Calocera viscosa TUFC12733]
MFGEDSSESPRMPSPWLALSPSLSHANSPSPRALRPKSSNETPSPQIEPLDLNAALGAFGDKLSQSLSSSFSSLSISPTVGDEDADAFGTGRRRSSGYAGSEAMIMPRLVPEVEEGNIEYKLKLIAPTPDRFARLVTQLKWRLLEGGGQAIYEIGVADSGQLVGLTQGELAESLETLERMADELGATVLISRAIEVPVLRGRIEGAGRVRGLQNLTPATTVPLEKGASKTLIVKRLGKYNHPIGREWENKVTSSDLAAETVAIDAGSRRDKKLAIKLKKRETLAGSHPNPRGVAKASNSVQRSPLSDNIALPDDESSSSGSETTSIASTASAALSTPALTISPTTLPPCEALPTILKPRQVSQPRGDPLLKAMAKRMKRDAARERSQGLFAPPLSADGATAMLSTESGVAIPSFKTDVQKNTSVKSGPAVLAITPSPVETALGQPTANGVSKNAEKEENKDDDQLALSDPDGDGDKENADDVEDEVEQSRWIVEVQVLRKMDADAGEGFLDFEGFGLE